MRTLFKILVISFRDDSSMSSGAITRLFLHTLNPITQVMKCSCMFGRMQIHTVHLNCMFDCKIDIT